MSWEKEQEFLVLETEESAIKRGVPIYARLLGAKGTSDAHGLTAPDKNAIGYINAVQLAAKQANIGLNQIDVFNAHGTSTRLNDEQEAIMYGKLLNPNCKTFSLKSQIGHLLGGAGAVETIASVLSLYHEFIPATINTTNSEYQINISNNVALNTPSNYHLKANAGFGGHNEALILGKYEK